MESKIRKFDKTKDITYIAVFSVIIALCSWLSIPTTVPFTMQTFAIFCTLGLLGGKRGFLSILVYILIGALGVPVFSGFKAGPGALFGVTGGYIIGFLFFALVYWGITKVLGHKTVAMAFAMVMGMFVCYAFGTAWFMIVYAKTSGAVGLATALGWCVVPFIVPDLVKLAFALLVTKKVGKFIK